MGLVLMGAIRPLQLPKGIKRAQWGGEGLHVGGLAVSTESLCINIVNIVLWFMANTHCESTKSSQDVHFAHAVPTSEAGVGKEDPEGSP